MSAIDNLRKDFLGINPSMGRGSTEARGSAGSDAGENEPQYVEIPEGYEVVPGNNGSYNIVPQQRNQNGVTTAIVKVGEEYLGDVKLGAIGTLGNLVVNSLGILPDAAEITELRRTCPTKSDGRVKRLWWKARYATTNLAAGLLMGNDDVLAKIEADERNVLADRYSQVIKDSRKRRSDSRELIQTAVTGLGQQEFDGLLNLADQSEFRSGDVTPEERHVALKLQSAVERDGNLSPRQWIEDEVGQRVQDVLLNIGSTAVLREEYTRLKKLSEKPTEGLPDSDGRITLVKQTPWQQFLASLLGAKGYSYKSLGGGSHVYLDESGSVQMQVGVEKKTLARALEDILVETDISDPFEQAQVIATRKINLPVISTTFEKLGTLFGSKPLRNPGMLKLSRSGAGTVTELTVANVKLATKGIKRLLETRSEATARIQQLPSSLPEVRYDDGAFWSTKTDMAEREITQLPRKVVVLNEAQLAARRKDTELFSSVGQQFPNDTQLKQFAGYDENTRARVRKYYSERMSDADSVDKIMAAISRQARYLK